MVALCPSLMQKIKERNNKPPRRQLVDHKRGQKLKNSWTATEEGSQTEMHGNLGMKSMLQRGMLEKTQLCQITSRETTGKGKEDGVRVCPCDAVRDTSCSTRGSQQQMEVFKWT